LGILFEQRNQRLIFITLERVPIAVRHSLFPIIQLKESRHWPIARLAIRRPVIPSVIDS
jgi:hypothetical protein